MYFLTKTKSVCIIAPKGSQQKTENDQSKIIVALQQKDQQRKSEDY